MSKKIPARQAGTLRKKTRNRAVLNKTRKHESASQFVRRAKHRVFFWNDQNVLSGGAWHINCNSQNVDSSWADTFIDGVNMANRSE